MRYAYKREPYFYANCKVVVDPFHMKGHSCSRSFDLKSYEEYMDINRYFFHKWPAATKFNANGQR